jgi:hypothetical protein
MLFYRQQIKKKNKNIISDIDKSSERPFYLSRINKPWRLTWLDEERPELFAYKAMNGCDGICRVEQCGLDNGYTLFICEDIEENPGKSTTNSIESIAFQLCKRFKVKPEKLILVEHYRESSISKESWLMVEFSERNMKSGFAGPTWRPMEIADWNRLGYEPRKRPIFGFDRSSMLKKV